MPYRFTTAAAIPEWLAAAWAAAAAFLYLSFGKGNVGVLALVLVAMVLECWTYVARAYVLEHEQFRAKDFAVFWIKRSALLVLPVLGVLVDFAWFWSSPENTILGAKIGRFATKGILVALFGWEVGQVFRSVQVLWRIPWLDRWMRLIDRMLVEGEPPTRRHYDPDPDPTPPLDHSEERDT